MNIVIQEGGIGKNLTADKLKTNLVGGGTCLWVPEDELNLGTKSVDENGTYYASDDGYDGYSSVTVAVNRISGKDDDGDDAQATVDPETGVIHIDKLPSSIRVTTPPTKVTYNDGETINFAGIVVKGYLQSGELWTDSSHPNGVIPISELAFPVTQADAGGAESGEWSDGQGINALLVSYTPHWDKDAQGREYQLYASDVVVGSKDGYPLVLGDTGPNAGPTQFFITKYGSKFYTWSGTAARYLNGVKVREGLHPKYILSSTTSYACSTGAVTSAGIPYIENVPESTVEPTGVPELQPESVAQSIPVQYVTGNGNTLEASFDIAVIP